jgi:ubiquinone/menaquinone biosynthesis C-methylase UbiE
MILGPFQTDSPHERDFYKRIAPHYDRLAGPFLKPVRNGVRQAAREFGCGRILDIACGTGEQVEVLAEDGFMTAGIDLSPAMISRARTRRHPRAAFFLGNAENLPFLSGSFECILMSLVLHEMNYSTAIRAAGEGIRVLTPGGKLILFDYCLSPGLLSRLSLALLHAVERGAGKIHFRNFRYFIKQGGLQAFVDKFPLNVISIRTFFAGGAALIVSEKRDG